MKRTWSHLAIGATVVGLVALAAARPAAAQAAKAAQGPGARAADALVAYQRHVETVGTAAADVSLSTRKAWVAALGGRGPSIAVAGLEIPPTTFKVPMPRARVRAAFNVTQAVGTKCVASIGIRKSGAETGAVDGLPSATTSRLGPIPLVTNVLALRPDVAYEASAQVGCVVYAPDGAIHAVAATITELRWEPQ